MILKMFYPYVTTILAATIAAAIRTRQLRSGIRRHQTSEAKHQYYATLLLLIYLIINLVTEIIAVQLARRYIYNHNLYALNILLSQSLLCASLSYFSRLHRLILGYSLIIQPLYLYAYIAGSYWRPESVMPQSLYAAHNALITIAAMLFCGIAIYRMVQFQQKHTYLGLGLICLLFHLYLQLANSFQFSETLSVLLHIRDVVLYLLICGGFYSALFIYLIRQYLQTIRNGQ